MNVTILSKVATSSRAADVVFKYLAKRERATWNLNLGRMYSEVTADGTSISREEFNKVFMALEKSGAGSVIHGRRGGADRFAWNYSFREAAKQTLQSLEAANRPKTSANISADSKMADIHTTPVVIQFSLPPNTSQKDIQALIELAKSLGT